MGVAIVAVGYNRPDSMENLLKSIVNAEYESDNVDLIISIDKGERQSQIIDVAKKVEWLHGNKTIRAFDERQGLRKHIIQCGDLTEQYDAVVVLEDDLEVSKYYYNYVKQMIFAYSNDEKIGGISLYKHETHPGVYRPFEPVNNGYDVYMMQFAMSWGQCWTRQMWSKFKEWYLANEGADLGRDGILPEYIARWNNQSWLKYYMRYIVESDLFFVYPYISLSTNASDAGEHCRIPNNDYQVPLLQGKLEYRIPDFENAIKYDVFFERMHLEIFPSLKAKVLLDLYGNRSSFGDARYVVSTNELSYKKIDSFQLKYRPIEMNCIIPSKGKGIYLYDLGEKAKVESGNADIITRYDVRALHWKKLLHLGLSGFFDAIYDRMHKGK